MEEKKKESKSLVSEIISWVIYLAAVFVLSWLIITFVGQRTVVDGSSMNPTLTDGDNLIVDKLTYHFRNPERYEVIVFPVEKHKYYIKRVIGLPGETIQIIDGEVYIDGELLGEDFGLETILDPGIAEYPITLCEDEYFVMGDNRNNSLDSRADVVGVIRRERFTGRAIFRIWPLSEIGTIRSEVGES